MTEKDFLQLFNDIEDKFIKEEMEEYTPVYPVYSEEPSVIAEKGFSWGKLAASAAACVCLVGGLIGLGAWFTRGNVSPNETIAATSAEEADLSLTEDLRLPADLPQMYQTTLKCNDTDYNVRILMYNNRSDTSQNQEPVIDPDHIWGDIAIEVSLNGAVTDYMEINEYCYGFGQTGGMPFDNEKLGEEYFRVFHMKQDVLAYITPNAKLGEEDKSNGEIVNARFFTIDKEGKIACFQRYATDWEKEKIGTRPNGHLFISDGCYFKIAPQIFDVKNTYILSKLNETVKNPWVDNDTVFSPGIIRLYFYFEDYVISCPSEYKYLVYRLTDTPPTVPPFAMLDGSVAEEYDITESQPGSQSDGSKDYYRVNSCFVVPYGTPAEKRTAGEKGDWIRLSKGDTIGGFTVTEAYGDYFRSAEHENYFPEELVQEIALQGQLSCTGTVTALRNKEGVPMGGSLIRLDQDACQKLFGIKPAIKYLNSEFDHSFDYDFNQESIYILIDSDTKGYGEISEALKTADTVKIKLETNNFRLRYYFETGYQYDGMQILSWQGDNYSLEIVE